MDILRIFKFVSIAEAFSWLFLIVATVVKRGFDGPETGVQILGPIHGILFIAFVGLIFVTRKQLVWDGRRTGFALASSVIPFAPFYVERNWIKEPLKA